MFISIFSILMVIMVNMHSTNSGAVPGSKNLQERDVLPEVRMQRSALAEPAKKRGKKLGKKKQRSGKKGQKSAKDTDIKEYFGTFGDIENINLKMDPMTGRSRGFAFIVFKELAGIEAALAQTAHVVKGKKV